ncbi:LysM peptidoglycan-binding domain-containing protein [Phosphitispora fastidiosa]|uniref:LysM peptidoglycan-binding domain-containing protein n=1 Tax=Phosphitispora fastidiosa TaxID=2837202 RepID=UPI001E48C379|nr:LysM domain-containing protein [Phosphitispora fastidiosa]MBU7007759.1 nucleoid-associated protein YgaU [Phosphitispora fastidiosa]
MAGDKQRFLFFKYVPLKKGEKPLKDKEYISSEDTENIIEAPDFIQGDQTGAMADTGGPVEPEVPVQAEMPAEAEENLVEENLVEENLVEENLVEENLVEEDLVEEDLESCPQIPCFPDLPECPELPEIPECPELPELPECPEIPEPPECPELPEIPECPEPPEEPEGPCPSNAIMHVIQQGDTFWKLSKKYGTTVEAITDANPEADPLNLQIGETLCIPVGIPGAKG